MGRIRVSSAKEDREEAVKQKLQSYRTLVAHHQSCCDLLDRLNPAVTSLIVEDRVAGGNSNKNEDRITARLDLEQLMAASLSSMRDEIAKILAVISSLTGDEYIVIFRRYALSQNMLQISQEMNNSEATCWRIYKHAICRLAKIDSE